MARTECLALACLGTMIPAPLAPLQAGSDAQPAGIAVQPPMLDNVHDGRHLLASEVTSSCVRLLARAWFCVCGCASFQLFFFMKTLKITKNLPGGL